MANGTRHTALAQDEPGWTSQRGRGQRVLVLDDDRDLLRMLTCMLEVGDHEVVTTVDGRETLACAAAAAAEGNPFDLAILDIVVDGGMGGLETIRPLKAAYPTMRALVSSGCVWEEAILYPGRHGFDAALPKPYTLQTLLDTVGAMLGTDAPCSARGQR